MTKFRINISCVLFICAVFVVSCAGKKANTDDINGISAPVRMGANSRAYFVSAAGDDARNNGLSEKSAFKTLQRALDAIGKDEKTTIIVIAGELTAATEGTPPASGSVFRIINSGKAEILITGMDENSKLSAAGSGKRAVEIDGNSKIRFEKIIISDGVSAGGGGILITGGADVTLGSDVIVRDNEAQNGGGVAVNGDSVFTLSGGIIKNNHAVSRGGGVATSGGMFVMRGGEITDNVTAGTGGGLSLADCLFNMDGGVISGNQAQSGGGVFLTSSGASGMTQGTIANNKADGLGGGMVIMRGNFTMSGGSVSGNQAQFGGGVAVSPAGVFSKSNGVIYGRDSESSANKASDAGNAVYKDGGTAHFRNTTVLAEEPLSSLDERGWE